MLAEFSSLQHCRQSRNAEADVRSDFQEKLFRNNFDAANKANKAG